MQRNGNSLMSRALMLVLSVWMMSTAEAGTPLWTLEPLTATTISVPANSTATVQYLVTNQSSKTHTLAMQPLEGITQTTAGVGVCANPFVLTGKASCTLSLQVNGSQLMKQINNGPIVCQQGSTNQCYRPGEANILHITQDSPITTATISVSGSPLTLTANGVTGQLTINNTSTIVTATNITSDFTGTALDGNVTETGNTCASVAPSASCTLTYTPGSSVVSQTDFSIQGSNTNVVTAAIQIQSGSTLSSISPTSGTVSGGTGFILTGTGLTGATAATFGGVAATSINVVNSTTVTGVTPAHSAGVVDVVITTPAGGATLSNGYTYIATAIGQSSGGGTIACLGSGLQNLIAATANNSIGIIWGGFGTAIGASAQSDTDGATNTTAIVSTLGAGISYAAGLCEAFEVDSQGNTPCISGNTCYNDWYLPAKDQLNCLFTNKVAIGGFDNSGYWSSTEDSSSPAGGAWFQEFFAGGQSAVAKNISTVSVRCVRSFTP